MGLLDDQLQVDASYMADTDVFGESVTHTPKGGSGTAYNAVVDRRPNEPVDGQARGRGHNVVVSLPRDASGSTGPASVSMGDTLAVKVRVSDDSASTLSVTEIIENDAGMWVLQCR